MLWRPELTVLHSLEPLCNGQILFYRLLPMRRLACAAPSFPMAWSPLPGPADAEGGSELLLPLPVKPAGVLASSLGGENLPLGRFLAFCCSASQNAPSDAHHVSFFLSGNPRPLFSDTHAVQSCDMLIYFSIPYDQKKYSIPYDHRKLALTITCRGANAM